MAQNPVMFISPGVDPDKILTALQSTNREDAMPFSYDGHTQLR